MTRDLLTCPFGQGQIEFRLERRERKTMAISVSPDLTVEVVAPNDAPVEKVIEKVRKRAAWIRRQQRFFDQFQPRTPARKYTAGETHLYLGRQYKLKVIPHVQELVKLLRGKLVVQTHSPRRSKVTERLVDDWFRERAHVKFRERLEICRQRFSNPDEFEPSSLVIRQMAQRWGSMSSTRKLILNRRLIQASVDAIDYVITHELCHIQHRHHDAEFYALLDRVMPDWEKRKLKMERQLA